MPNSPLAIRKRTVPSAQGLKGNKLPDTVDRTHAYITKRAQFDSAYLDDFQRALSDNNGQASGGIVNAVDLTTRLHIYQLVAAAMPHVGDLPSQPSVVTYDGPLNFGALPAGVNPAFGYARWAGWLNIAQAGDYTFQQVSNGGSNLFLNKAQLVGELAAAATNYTSGPIPLTAGLVPIVVEWEWQNNPSFVLNWQTPTTPMGLIPDGVFSKSVNGVSGYIVGFWWNGSAQIWFP